MRTQDISRHKDYRTIENPGDDALFVENYNIMVDDLNKRMKDFPFSGLNGHIIEEVSLAATSETRISHSLKTIPKYRLILGQTGNGVITDVKAKWTDKHITLYNNGAVTVTLILLIIRE